jgi:hypothetical protein
VLAAPAHPVLYDKDGSHPTIAGSFLAACVFFGVLFKEEPAEIRIEIPGLNNPAQAMLEKTAWETCKPKPTKRIP